MDATISLAACLAAALLVMRFLALWRQHRFALQALQARLQEVASVRIQPAPSGRESTYA